MATTEELERRILLLEQIIRQHTGSVSGISTANLPHPNISAIGQGAYTITNGTTDRTYNADTVAVAELADIVYTLIQDLKLLGLVG